ncbi:MAG: tagatose-bisphosphate aldolase [Candidatus Harrisonbacteria bacterium CG10_big_fil_rev_8_21_14_0_10_38_8]|uniref:Tagatose-bisphosphate aldolase n=1 Tax=Candidatus Harrisonbacteria bacterium CG10_big_fil_rev_8_21_14_0_10_38_8 TaxID=1974582 RepID=A0A2M6WKA5_9BACT|nr:MAG: tagatose-bisphosphate aldolase [Candidatus Harrisonbacteria bacterium CG10_big_fil_rev_8_21_14_0_10_38_8]
MKNLIEAFAWAEEKKVAIGHFNIANIEMLKGVYSAAKKVSSEMGEKIPVVIGASDGERGYIGSPEVVSIIRTMREADDYPIFLNADHSDTAELAKQAVDDGFDMVIIDEAEKSLEENIKNSKEVVSYAKEKGYQGLIEGEVGYIGSGSSILQDIPEGAAITIDAVASVEDCKRYVEETGVDLLAPAVGNIHGMIAKGKNPHLFIERIKEIKEAVNIPLVLHGASGIPDEDISPAIKAGINMIHVSTEIRKAWRQATDYSLEKDPDQIAPYKLTPLVIEAIEKVVVEKLRLFNNL